MPWPATGNAGDIPLASTATGADRGARPSTPREVVSGSRIGPLAIAFLVCGVAVVLLKQRVTDGPVSALLYLSGGVAASVAAAVCARRRSLGDVAMWWCIAAGCLLFTIGDAFWEWYHLVAGEVPLVSLADVWYLVGYLPLGTGLALLLRQGRRGRDVDALVDGAIIGVAFLTVAWLLLIEPRLVTDGPVIAQVVGSLYAVADITMLTLIVRLMARPCDGHSHALALLALGMASTFAGDLAFLLFIGGATSIYSTWLDATWLAGYVLIGTAALCEPAGAPAPGELVVPPDRTEVASPWRRTIALGLALAVSPLLALVRGVGSPDRTMAYAGVSGLVLVGLVSARLGRLATLVRRQLQDARSLQATLAHQVTHDAVTGLPNRPRFAEELSRALDRRADGHVVGLLFIDLDQFKAVNDTLGHGIGDQVLRSVADRIGRALRDDDVLARFGGDEFVVLLEGIESEGEAMTIGRRVADAVREPARVAGEPVTVTATVGVTVTDDHAVTADEVLRDADAALLEGKHRGRDVIVAFDASMRDHLARWLETENELREALDRGELRLHYQPEIDLAASSLFGVEALVRWDHPGRGLVAPGEFLPVAERSGLIVPIGRWVVEEACRQARRWLDALGDDAPVISVNVSPTQLAREDVSAHIQRHLSRHDLPPSALRVEVTETALVSAHTRVVTQVQQLHDLGVEVAVDDFGTGFFSLSHLKRLAVDLIKIDSSFVAGVGCDRIDDAVIHAVVDLSRRLGVRTIAEGVETAEQVCRVRAAGCDVVQGFHYARPMAAEEVDARISAGAFGPRLPPAPDPPERPACAPRPGIQCSGAAPPAGKAEEPPATVTR